MKTPLKNLKSGGRILLVDDDPDWPDMIKSYLKDLEPEIVMAEDGVAALSELENQPFDLAILDTNMPRMNGIELLKIIRSRFPHLLVILFFSGLAGSALTSEEVFRLGANAILEKHQAPNYLLPLVTGLLTAPDLIANTGQNRSRAVLYKSLISCLRPEGVLG